MKYRRLKRFYSQKHIFCIIPISFTDNYGYFSILFDFKRQFESLRLYTGIFILVAQ